MSDDHLAIRPRLYEFLTLQLGWLNGEGVAFTQTSLDWLADGFATYYPGDMPTPYLYPLPTEGVSAEWHTPVFMLVVEVDLGSQQADASVLWRSNRSCYADGWQFDLSTATGWGELVKQLRGLMEAA